MQFDNEYYLKQHQRFCFVFGICGKMDVFGVANKFVCPTKFKAKTERSI